MDNLKNFLYRKRRQKGKPMGTDKELLSGLNQENTLDKQENTIEDLGNCLKCQENTLCSTKITPFQLRHTSIGANGINKVGYEDVEYEEFFIVRFEKCENGYMLELKASNNSEIYNLEITEDGFNKLPGLLGNSTVMGSKIYLARLFSPGLKPLVWAIKNSNNERIC